jgi:hypothetical protein
MPGSKIHSNHIFVGFNLDSVSLRPVKSARSNVIAALPILPVDVHEFVTQSAVA